MNRTPHLVSVIIPCYNDGKFIHEAIGSILKQTYKNYEIIVVDDGSDDKKTIRTLDKIDLSKTLVYRKENGGPASARNFGINKSNGEFILTLDADDKFHPSFLEKSVPILTNNPEIGMVTSYQERIYKDKTTKIEISGGDVSSFIIHNDCSASLLFRPQCWEDANGYDENIPGFEDWDFALSVTKKGWIVYSIPEVLFYYTNRNGSQYDKDVRIRPKIMKYLINKHKSVFQKHITDVIYEKEIELQNQANTISTYKNSYAQKIGNAVIKPVKALRSLLFLT